MKFTLENGCTVEIKVKNSNGKTDLEQELDFILVLEYASSYAAAFCASQGWHESSQYYFRLFEAMKTGKK